MVTSLSFSLLEEVYKPNEIILETDEVIQEIIIVLYGEIDVQLKMGYYHITLLDRLRSRCTFGYHSTLRMMMQDEEPIKSKFTLVAREDTTILRLDIERLRALEKKSSMLSTIFEFN